MKIILHTLVLTLLFSHYAVSQSSNQIEAGIDVGTGFKNKNWAPSVLYHEDVSLGRLSWLRAGLGIRAWGYYGGKSNLTSQANEALAHELHYQKTSVNGLSFVAAVSVKFWRIDLGANTDLIGAAFGANRKALYPAGSEAQGTGNAYYNKSVSTRPVIFNTLPLFLNNYNGQSEVYARVLITRGMGVKVGYLFGQLAYVSRNKDGERVLLDGGERRFSNRYQMPYVALTFPINQ